MDSNPQESLENTKNTMATQRYTRPCPLTIWIHGLQQAENDMTRNPNPNAPPIGNVYQTI